MGKALSIFPERGEAWLAAQRGTGVVESGIKRFRSREQDRAGC